jgi:hypothetical protein
MIMKPKHDRTRADAITARQIHAAALGDPDALAASARGED